MRCVELVFDEMLKIVNGCETKVGYSDDQLCAVIFSTYNTPLHIHQELIRFPRLHQKVVEVVVEMLRERMAPAHAYLESLISIQLAYINTNHPDFIGGSAAIAMLERKHEKRRRDLDKHRKQQQAMQQQVQNMSLNGSGANGNVAGNGRDSTKAAVFADDVTSAEPQSSKTHPLGMASLAAKSGESGPISALHQSLPHGRDGGFLTYFFGGNPVSISPELRTSSRAPSPTRRDGSPAANELYDMMSSRSDDTATFVNHQQSIASEREEIEVELIRSLIQSYFRITRKTIADLIPKTVMHLIVNHARENIQNRLVSTLYREDLFAELLMEDPEVMSERTKCKALLDTYKRGAAVLQDIY